MGNVLTEVHLAIRKDGFGFSAHLQGFFQIVRLHQHIVNIGIVLKLTGKRGVIFGEMGQEDGGKQEGGAVHTENHPFVLLASDVVGGWRFGEVAEPKDFAIFPVLRGNFDGQKCGLDISKDRDSAASPTQKHSNQFGQNDGTGMEGII